MDFIAVGWIIAIYSTAIKSILSHEKTQDILFLERPQGESDEKKLPWDNVTLFDSSKGTSKYTFASVK